VLLITMPTIVALNFKVVPLGMLDYVIATAVLVFIVIETIADKQQWDYQRRKQSATKADRESQADLRKGFLDRGLWAWSRHPNYFAEQAIWVCFYFFSVTASGQWINWSIMGCLLLILLFRGSSTFSEEISASKYSEYADYQHRVPRFFPWHAFAPIVKKHS